MMRLPADAYPRTERHALPPSSVAHRHEPRLEPRLEPLFDPRERASEVPSDELVDIYAAALIAVPLALFLRWLWP